MENEIIKNQSIGESLLPLEKVTAKLDSILSECCPVLLQKGHLSMQKTLVLAKGIELIREEFRTNAVIKATILALVNTPLGFMTDRTKEAIEKSRGTKRVLVPYTYEEISECVLEGMLNGYRPIKDEMNILAGKFYGAKPGKWRLIIEYPGLSNFIYRNDPPKFFLKDEWNKWQNKMEKIEYATVQAYASWELDGKPYSIGDTSKNEKDILIFQVKVNTGMGLDAVQGKAHSKLFSRVLSRLYGTIFPESTDIDIEQESGQQSQIENMTSRILHRDDVNESIPDKEKFMKLINSSGIPTAEFLMYLNVKSIDEISPETINAYVKDFSTVLNGFNSYIDNSNN